MHRLCHLALTEIALASSDVVFTAGAADTRSMPDIVGASCLNSGRS